jgi:hypothetical protein
MHGIMNFGSDFGKNTTMLLQYRQESSLEIVHDLRIERESLPRLLAPCAKSSEVLDDSEYIVL